MIFLATQGFQMDLPAPLQKICCFSGGRGLALAPQQGTWIQNVTVEGENFMIAQQTTRGLLTLGSAVACVSEIKQTSLEQVSWIPSVFLSNSMEAFWLRRGTFATSALFDVKVSPRPPNQAGTRNQQPMIKPSLTPEEARFFLSVPSILQCV